MKKKRKINEKKNATDDMKTIVAFQLFSLTKLVCIIHKFYSLYKCQTFNLERIKIIY